MCALLLTSNKDKERIDDVIGPVDIWIAYSDQWFLHNTNALDNSEKSCEHSFRTAQNMSEVTAPWQVSCVKFLSTASWSAPAFSTAAAKGYAPVENLLSFSTGGRRSLPLLTYPPFSPMQQTHIVHRHVHKVLRMTLLLLASQSAIRLTLLQNAGVPVQAHPARVDEQALCAALQAEQATPRDIADALAEAKALKLAQRHPQALVLGCDQVLAYGPRLFSKPTSRLQAREQLVDLSGQTHQLLSAAVLYHEGQPIWRHVAVARLTMRRVSDAYLDDYLDRNWPAIQQSVGSYQLEGEGIRLFSAVEGDYFTILGLPLLPLLSYLSLRGFIPS